MKKMNPHTKKMIAPIVIVLIIAGYYCTAGFVVMHSQLPKVLTILLVAFSLAVTILLVFVLSERIKEIRKGEGDDLGKY